MPVSVVTAATTYPVTRAEVKTHCRVDTDVDDSLIDGLIAAANEYVAKWCGRAFAGQTLAAYFDTFADEMLLPQGPVQAVSSVKYLDAAGDEQTLSASVYYADLLDDPQHIVLRDGQSWPATEEIPNAVWATYTTAAPTCPAPVKQAMLLLIGLWYDARAAASERAMTEMPHAVEALLCNYRAFT